ncbi:MAG: GNAT family N-acetyltransferase [Oscillospiraceae bacterium]|nr:GNAT family N-acetyltransferase [Oscillospiraceae bacterium]
MEQLKMLRESKIVDPAKFPEGYHMRSYIGENGDGAAWCKCCLGGELGIEEASEAAFENKMLADKYVNPQNIFFLVSPMGEIAGTVTYQYTGDEDTGCIHMVAIEKSHQGKKLALPMILYAVQKILADGRKNIVLTTDDWRISAIKTYLRAGFCPVIGGDAEMEKRWKAVQNNISNI